MTPTPAPMPTACPKRKDFTKYNKTTEKREEGKGYGTQGRKIQVRANMFPVKFDFDKQRSIFHYDVAVADPKKPERDLPKKLNEDIVRTFIKQYESTLFKNLAYAYDGMKNIVTNKQIDTKRIPVRERAMFTVTYIKPGAGKREEEFDISVRFAQEIPMSNIKLALAGAKDLDLTLVQFLDIILMQGFKMNDGFTNVGRNFFLKNQGKGAKGLGKGREIWFGFHQSLRPCSGRMMLNIDVAATTFYVGQKLIDYASQIVRPVRPTRDNPTPKQAPMPKTLTDVERKTLEKELKACKVKCNHSKHERHYKILKLLKDSANTKKFEHDGQKITVAKYFEKQYKQRLMYPELPIVQMLPKDKGIYLPMEMCEVIGGEHYKKKLDSDAQANMVRSCARPADEREKTINYYAQKNGYSKDATINGFNIKVEPKMAEITARQLPPRTVVYAKNKTEKPGRGQWENRGKLAHTPAVISDNWCFICSDNPKFTTQDQLQDFGQKLIKGARNVGINMKPPRDRKYIRHAGDLDRLFSDLKKNNCKFIVCVIGNRGGDDVYKRVKQLGDIEHGIVTQCFKSANLRKANDQLIGNLMMKINAKHGGVNNICRNPDGKSFLTKPTIIIGADVTHPAPGDNSKPSIAALTASMNADASKYVTEIRVQNHRQEMIGSVEPGKPRHLESAVVKFLKDFYTATKGKKPQHIIYMRDGVSEGQFSEVLRTELKQIRTACQVLNSSYKPTMTIVCCQKRHHVRLFPANPKDAEGKSKNVPAGTIVDTDITHPTENDFYLVSHAGIQGTSRPTKYHVLFNDDPAVNADSLQDLVYGLCHVYQRCARSVSLPAPVYYAHLAATQATVHLADIEDGCQSTYSGDSCETFNSGDVPTMQKRVELSTVDGYAKKVQHYI